MTVNPCNIRQYSTLCVYKIDAVASDFEKIIPQGHLRKFCLKISVVYFHGL